MAGEVDISECELHIASAACENKARGRSERERGEGPEPQASFAGPPCRAGKWVHPISHSHSHLPRIIHCFSVHWLSACHVWFPRQTLSATRCYMATRPLAPAPAASDHTLAKVKAYLMEQHVSSILWHYTLNNNSSTRPNMVWAGGQAVDQISRLCQSLCLNDTIVFQFASCLMLVSCRMFLEV